MYYQSVLVEKVWSRSGGIYFSAGHVNLTVGKRYHDFKAARDLFSKEIARDGYNHEFHFWLAAAYSHLGDSEQARKHLKAAMEFSNTRQERDLYAAKLDRISSYH